MSFKFPNNLPIFFAYVIRKNLLVYYTSFFFIFFEKLSLLVGALPLVGCSRPIVYYIHNFKPRMVCVVSLYLQNYKQRPFRHIDAQSPSE
jgi:hypothetical protein